MSKTTSIILLALVTLSVLWPGVSSAQTGQRTLAPIVISDLKSPSYAAIGSTVTFSGTATDDIGVLSVEITFTNGLTWDNITDHYDNFTTKYSFPWDTTGQTSGVHQITIRARDGEYKLGSTLVSLTLDNDQPDVVIKQPAETAVTLGLGDTIALSGTASDGTTPLTFLNISLDGGANWIEIISALKSKSWTYNWVTKASDPPLKHWVIVQAMDTVGHTGLASMNITLADLKAPLVAITTPTDAKEFTTWDSISVKGTASDNVGVQTLEVAAFMKGATVKKTNITGRLDAGSWAWNWDTKGLTAGVYTIQAWAKDKKGNQVTAFINVTFSDETLPTVTISAPLDKTSFKHGEAVYVAGKATDNIKIRLVELTVDGTAAINITKDVKTSGDYSHTLVGLKDGNHQIKVKATDMSGNTKDAQIIITLKKQPATTNVAAIAGGVVAVVVVIIIILFIGVKKGWFGSKKQQPVPGTQSMATPPMQTQPPLAPPTTQAQQVPSAYPTYSQQPMGPSQPLPPPPEPYTPAPVYEPIAEEDMTPKLAPMPIDVDAEEEPALPKPVPKPPVTPVEARAPIPGPPKKPGFQRPALAKNPQQAPERCPSCGLDVDYEFLKCQECGAKLF
jgi:hypothetical protein